MTRPAKPQKSVHAHLFFALLYHREMGLISFTTKIEDDSTPTSIISFNL